MIDRGHRLALSVDLEEWFHSRRWVNAGRRAGVRSTDTVVQGRGEVHRSDGRLVAPTLALLDLFERYRCRCTFFVLGEVAQRHPDLVGEIAARGHEIACHALNHVDMTGLGPDVFEHHVASSTDVLARLTGRRPIGFRAPNLVYEPWATAILERQGFLYDSTVCASRAICGKYRGWFKAPSHPYRPSYDAIERPGDARLIELPLASFPGLKLPAGSGIATRIIGPWWTRLALQWRLRTGSTVYYLHSWEVGPRPPVAGPRLRHAVFVRRTGQWMFDVVEGLLRRFGDRIITAGRLATMSSGEMPKSEHAPARILEVMQRPQARLPPASLRSFPP